MNELILECRQLSKSYKEGKNTIEVLNALDFSLNQGDNIAITGPSGSGKSTFLHLLGGLDTPSSGQVLILNQDWQTLKEKSRCRLRNQHLGFVYQFHHLLPEFTALENVALPLMLGQASKKEALESASDMLAEVGLAQRKAHKPSELSGGERQRVAIARALIHKPHCILADEPTGNLDQHTAAKVFELMLNMNEKFNTALIVVTHDHALAGKMKLHLKLNDGKLSV